jgi:hypothetical protein
MADKYSMKEAIKQTTLDLLRCPYVVAVAVFGLAVLPGIVKLSSMLP